MRPRRPWAGQRPVTRQTCQFFSGVGGSDGATIQRQHVPVIGARLPQTEGQQKPFVGVRDFVHALGPSEDAAPGHKHVASGLRLPAELPIGGAQDSCQFLGRHALIGRRTLHSFIAIAGGRASREPGFEHALGRAPARIAADASRTDRNILDKSKERARGTGQNGGLQM